MKIEQIKNGTYWCQSGIVFDLTEIDYESESVVIDAYIDPFHHSSKIKQKTDEIVFNDDYQYNILLHFTKFCVESSFIKQDEAKSFYHRLKNDSDFRKEYADLSDLSLNETGYDFDVYKSNSFIFTSFLKTMTTECDFIPIEYDRYDDFSSVHFMKAITFNELEKIINYNSGVKTLTLKEEKHLFIENKME